MDDDDEVAIDDGVEPADTTDGGAADEPAGRVAAGGSVTAVIPVKKGTRPISDKVREVFAASMAKMKAKPGGGEDEGGLESVEHDELPTETAPAATQAAPAETPAPVTAQPPVAAAPPPAPVTPPPAAAPTAPAPSLDPEVMRMRTDLEQQRRDFDAERAKFLEQSRTSDVAKLRDTYFDKGAPAVVEVVKQWMPGLEGEDLKREVADLIQDLAHQYLDAPLDEPVKDRITNKRVRAGLKTWKAEQERIESERQKQLIASQEEQNRVQVKKILHQEVLKPEHASQYPWLASEDNAGDLIYEVINTQYLKDQTQLTWQDAAKRANDWLENQSRSFYDKRRHLLSPPPPEQQAAPADKQRTQGDNQVSRSQAPPKKPTPPAKEPERPVQNGKWSPEQHRRSVMQKFRGQLQAMNDEE